jgi:predicted phage-related endonuclease
VIELLLRFERTFWARVEGRLGPPPVDGSVHTTAAIREALRASTPGKAVELPAELAPTLKTLVEAKSAIKVAEGWAREAQNALMVSMGDAEVAYLDGREVVTWREHEEHRLDQKALREAEPALAERYTRTSTVRTFLVKGGTA